MTIPKELQGILVSTPDTLGGSVRFKGTRIPVQALLDTLICHHTIDYFLEGFPESPGSRPKPCLDGSKTNHAKPSDLNSSPKMRVLLDNCVDVRFARLITGHEVLHARDLGRQELGNGKLLAVAEEAGFAVFVTTDKNIRHQQNMAKKGISLITLSPHIKEFDFIAPLPGRLAIELSRELASGSEIVIKPDEP